VAAPQGDVLSFVLLVDIVEHLGDIEPVRVMRHTTYTSRDVTAWTAPYRPRIAVIELMAPYSPSLIGLPARMLAIRSVCS